MEVSVKSPEKNAEQLFADEVRAAGLDAPWFHPGPLIQPKKSKVESGLWKWAPIEKVLRKTPEFVAPGKGADRRILRIANPGVPELTATHTISIAIQYLLPGEVAPAHRHTPNAARFMIHGEGAYTTIDGDRCHMLPGDVVLTPAGTWHDHGNEGSEPVIWMDILDSPVVRFLEGLGMESYPHEKQTEGIRNAVSERRYGATGLLPAGHEASDKGTLLHFRGKNALDALARLAEVQNDPFDGAILEYVEPRTGRSIFPCLGFYLQMIRPGIETKAHRQNSSSVYLVLQGSGTSIVNGRNYQWSKGDVLVIAPSDVHQHKNSGSEPAILFSAQDIPLLRALGFYREEAV